MTTANFGAPNHERALKQHAAYCQALEQCGLRLTRLEADERFPDATFVEDTAVIPGARLHSGKSTRSAILTCPGASSRAGEVKSMAEVLSRFFGELRSIEAPGTLDGGDVCEADDHFLIGISERTNEEGAQQLAKLLVSHDYPSTFVDIRGMKNILHLKSGLAYLGNNRLAVIDALAAHAAFRAYELVRVHETEQRAANCVPVNDRVLVAAGCPEFERTLVKSGYETIAVEISEFQKMDGGLSCLSLRF